MKIKEVIIVFFVIIVTGLLILYISYTNGRVKNIQNNVNQNIIEYNFYIQQLLNRDSLVYLSIGNYIHLNTPIVNQNCIFLRLHKNVCISCYAIFLNKVKSILESFDYKLIIIGSYSYKSFFYDLLKKNNLEHVVSYNDENLYVNADDINIPYLFTLSEDNQIESILFINKHSDNRERIENYLIMINKIH